MFLLKSSYLDVHIGKSHYIEFRKVVPRNGHKENLFKLETGLLNIEK